eukprot:2863244-Rhodomonas_salina.1
MGQCTQCRLSQVWCYGIGLCACYEQTGTDLGHDAAGLRAAWAYLVLTCGTGYQETLSSGSVRSYPYAGYDPTSARAVMIPVFRVMLLSLHLLCSYMPPCVRFNAHGSGYNAHGGANNAHGGANNAHGRYTTRGLAYTRTPGMLLAPFFVPHALVQSTVTDIDGTWTTVGKDVTQLVKDRWVDSAIGLRAR